MGHKVFVSYKYHDWNVADLPNRRLCTVRDYVDVLEAKLGRNNVYKGEQDGEDLSHLNEETIWNKFKDRIFDSSVTIVMVSKGMRETDKYDRSQWIPWEVRYSLCEYSKNDTTSHTNGLLYVVLPDIHDSYDYFVERKRCCDDGCDSMNTDVIFAIMERNLFNSKENHLHSCDYSNNLYSKLDSYAIVVKWEDFMESDLYMQMYIETAFTRSQHKSEYILGTKINRT